MRSSELILNPDGSIYHLHLRPEQVAPLIITVGDQDRVAQVSRHFDRVEHRVQKREFVTHTGYIGRTRISVISTGIGPDNIDIVLNELDAVFNVDFDRRAPRAEPVSLTIIRLGTAGCLRAEVPVDALVASSGALGLDGLLHFYAAPNVCRHPLLDALRRHFDGQWDFPLAPYFVEANAALLAHFGAPFVPGITATNAGFYAPQGRQLRAPVRMQGYLDVLGAFAFEGRQVVNLEMETATIYGLAELLGHRAISLNAILANRAAGTFSADPAAAVEKLIETALERIVQL